MILPALGQLVMEHQVTINFLEALCYYSPLVPQNHVRLTAKAFSYEAVYAWWMTLRLIVGALTSQLVDDVAGETAM